MNLGVHMPESIQGRRLNLCGPAVYCITVQGKLDADRAAWFDAVELVVCGEQTTLKGQVADQAALHGLLARVRDLGLPLVEVRWLAEHH
jgi:hypothetical protein